MQEKKRKKGRLLMGLGLILLAAAFVLMLRLIKEERDADASAQRVLAMMEESAAPAPTETPTSTETPVQKDSALPTAAASSAPQPTSTPAPEKTASPLQTPRLALFEINPDMEMPIQVIEGHEYIGILDFPVLDLSLPVMSDWDYIKLKIAPCRYKGSAYTGDLIISGHNYDRHFGRFSSMLVGDEIRFTDMDGNVFIYTVCAKETLDMRDVEGMLEGEWDMTLFTCVPGGARRETLRCTLERYETAALQDDEEVCP